MLSPLLIAESETADYAALPARQKRFHGTGELLEGDLSMSQHSLAGSIEHQRHRHFAKPIPRARRFEEELAKTMAEPRAEKGKLPPWYPRFPGWEEIKTTPSVARPTDLEILVLGDPSRNKVQILSAGGYKTIEIRLPGNWDELMKAAGYRALSEFFLSAPNNQVAQRQSPAMANAAQ